MTEQAELNRDEMPFVAPCKKLSPWAPFRWVKLGIKDLVQAPQHSMAYGLTVALMIGIVCLLAWFRGSQWIMFAMIGGFVFLAPLTCIGLYAISAQLERGQATAHGAQCASGLEAPLRQRDDLRPGAARDFPRCGRAPPSWSACSSRLTATPRSRTGSCTSGSAP